MRPLLSICIPTLNRPEFLLQALESIALEKDAAEHIEICISNNGSESDYSKVEARIASLSTSLDIKYIRHQPRIPLDQNHHFVKKLATSEYIYFLGDDDFFLRGSLGKLLSFISEKKPDLAIFNGLLVDARNQYLGKHFNLPAKHYVSAEDAFVDLKDKGSFGSVLARVDMLSDADFERLYETDHAYGCYWLAIFRMYAQGTPINVFVPDFPCVALRCAEKSYNHIYVYFGKIPHWMEIHRQLVPPGGLQKLMYAHAAASNGTNESFRFLLHLAGSGNNLDLIRTADAAFYKKHRLKITLCKYLAASPVYRLLRNINHMRSAKRSRQIPEEERTTINQLLSLADKS